MLIYLKVSSLGGDREAYKPYNPVVSGNLKVAIEVPDDEVLVADGDNYVLTVKGLAIVSREIANAIHHMHMQTFTGE